MDKADGYPFTFDDANEVTKVCEALQIYEDNMSDVCRNTPGLTDDQFESEHKESTVMALQHLGDVPAALHQMLTELIELKLQRLRGQVENNKKLAMKNLTCVDAAMEICDDSNSNLKTRSNHSISSNGEAHTKLHFIAKELLSTEEVYVDTLHLIDQVFHKKLQAEALIRDIIPEAEVNKIFGHVSAIYQFHLKFLLPQIKERLDNWDNNPQIGDVMMQAGPFLKIYATYTQNYKESLKTLDHWLKKSKHFSYLVHSITTKTIYPSLPLQAHMVTPIQRIPRYRLLLVDYLTRLSEDALDKKEAEKALELISDVALHLNETLKLVERRKELVKKLQDLKNVDFDITEVFRNLLKEGSVKRLDNWEDKKSESYLYLLSDMLLDCSSIHKIPLNKSYKVRARIDLAGAQVFEVRAFDGSHGFCVHGIKESVEFATETSEESRNWMQAIKDAIEEYECRKNSFRISPSQTFENKPEFPSTSSSNSFEIKDEKIGKRCPRWIKDREASMCMICSKSFGSFRHKQHCRACGKVVCLDCSDQQHKLDYIPGETQKVCIDCHKMLNSRRKVDASEFAQNSLLADFLYFRETSNIRKMTEYWCFVPTNELKVYIFKEPRDLKEERIIDLKDCKISCCNECQEQTYCFKLEKEQSICFLATKDKKLAQKWLYLLSEGAEGRKLTEEDIKDAESKGPSLPTTTTRRLSFLERVATLRRRK
ncbi:FYVE, RhoGEF and PH domain-containing protein 2-like isoform X2 [Clavelina lepadiformis]|uniref:FYVE, RhoGEF and PH domain-containing protein 2-like isoform X2 n=1 Tax=Clavelina lepadiformis TaxID=159417 RepID=UPI0040415DE8